MTPQPKLLWVLLRLLTVALAQDTFSISDVPGYTEMPDCAQNALYYGVFTSSKYDNCQIELPATAYLGCLCSKDSTIVEAEITNVFSDYSSSYSYSLCGTSEIASATSVWGNICAEHGGGSGSGAQTTDAAGVVIDGRSCLTAVEEIVKPHL
ncbi:MAG: hypothetical protein Q9216_003994 [Gyalolechia sp. 2 TL-2023]